MLELVVVISIALILLSVLVVSLGNAIQIARRAATEATLLKIDGILQQRIEAFRTAMESPQGQAMIKSRMAAKQNELLSQSIGGAHERFVRLLVMKDLFRFNFPQTLSDNISLGTAGQPFEGNAQNAAESAEMLFWLITQSDTFGVAPVEESEFSSSEVADTDGDGRKEFVDAWGNPLRFYRWPTRLLRPGGPGTALRRDLAGVLISGIPSGASQVGDADPAAVDPEDSLGVYVSTINTIVMTPEQYENLAHTPDTFWTPLIVSAGPDRDLALQEPFHTSGRLAQPTADAIANFGTSGLVDNLSSKQKQR